MAFHRRHHSRSSSSSSTPMLLLLLLLEIIVMASYVRTTAALSSRPSPWSAQQRSSARPTPPRLGTVRPTIVRSPTKSVEELVASVNASVTSGAGGLRGVPRGVIEWFLLDRYFDARRASEKLVSMASWRRRFAEETRGVSTARERRTRKGYLHEHRDVNGRPVVVAVAARHNTFLRSLPESKLLCVEVLEEGIRGLDDVDAAAAVAAVEAGRAAGQQFTVASSAEDGAAGGVTQVLGVFDLRNLTPTCIDFEFVSFLIDTVYNFYPQRLGQVLLVQPPPFVFEAAWEIIKPQIGKHADIVRFVQLGELSEYFTPETLPADFRE